MSIKTKMNVKKKNVKIDRAQNTRARKPQIKEPFCQAM